MQVISLNVQCIVYERKFLEVHFRTVKRQFILFDCKRLAQLGSGPLLFLLSLSGHQNLLYGNSDHIFFMATTYCLLEIIPWTRNFYYDLFISNYSNYFNSGYWPSSVYTEQRANIFHVQSKVTFIYSNSGNPISCVQHSNLLVLSGRTEKDASLFPWKALTWLEVMRCVANIKNIPPC